MWSFIFYFFSIKLILLKGAVSISVDQSCPSENSTVSIYVLDKESLPLLTKEVELLNSSNEILKQRLEFLSLRLNNQIEIWNKFNSMPPYQSTFFFNDKKESQQLNLDFFPRKYPRNCAEATSKTNRNGIYTIQVDLFSAKPFLVSCNSKTQGGRWTIIQRRQDGRIDFFREWADYKMGFGNLDGEFFIGLDKLHALTLQEPQELLIVMSDFENVTKTAKYETFAIGDEIEGYVLNALGAYSGDAGDSFRNHAGQKFTAKDRKNDESDSNCAQMYKGGWWYKKCHSSNLNGLYLKGEYEKDKYAQGVVWFDWHGHYYSLKRVEMLIRPRGF